MHSKVLNRKENTELAFDNNDESVFVTLGEEKLFYLTGLPCMTSTQ